MGCGCLALIFGAPLLAALMFFLGGEIGWMWFAIFLWLLDLGNNNNDEEKTP